MGMFDDFSVVKDNKVGIPGEGKVYQSKRLDCTLSVYHIDAEGLITDGSPSNGYFADSVIEEGRSEIQNYMFCGSINIYGEIEGSWVELLLYVENNQILLVADWNRIIYKDPDCDLPAAKKSFEDTFIGKFDYIADDNNV